jgi:hypothetical protein
MAMRKTLLIILASLLSACASQGVVKPVVDDDIPSHGGSGDPNILIMGEDVDPDSVARNSRAFKRTLNALANQLSDQGFSVYDETHITLDGYAQGRVRRSDAEIIDIARSVRRPPIDVAVIFTAFTDMRNKGYTNKMRTRIEGRLLNVRNGKRLGNFELASPEQAISPSCKGGCLLEAQGEQTRMIANDLGAVLTEKLEWMVAGKQSSGKQSGGQSPVKPLGAFTLVFDGFTPEEIMAMEEYLVVFSGYHSHRPIYNGYRRSEIWYESSISSAKLDRNLKMMLDEMKMRGLVQYAGDTYTVKRIRMRSKLPKDPNYKW